jgi:hypothetical protein
MCASARRFSGTASSCFFEGEETVPRGCCATRHLRRGAPLIRGHDHAISTIGFGRAMHREERCTASGRGCYPITIFVSGPSRCSKRSIAAFVIETHPAVAEKFSRARCKNTALPRPAMRGELL